MKSVSSRPDPSAETGGAAELPPAADDVRSWLSALADGDEQAASKACKAWRDDPDARATWHAYHLIGDVMRSDDLAHRPKRDADFLAGIRARLADEPVVMAPVAVAPPAPRRRQPWLVPTAAAAGFAVVAGVLVVARLGMPGGAVDTGPVLATSATGAAPLAQSRNGNIRQVMLRDARVDEYLRVHQATRGGVIMMAPSGGPRSNEVAVPVAHPAVSNER